MDDEDYIEGDDNEADCDNGIGAEMACSSAGLHESLQPCSRAARKWRENEEMRRKWRENEEMERE